MLHDQLNMYHTNVATRLNEMFRILTVFSVFFVPTYCRNLWNELEYIPELKYHNAYFVLWGVMVFMAISMVLS